MLLTRGLATTSLGTYSKNIRSCRLRSFTSREMPERFSALSMFPLFVDGHCTPSTKRMPSRRVPSITINGLIFSKCQKSQPGATVRSVRRASGRSISSSDTLPRLDLSGYPAKGRFVCILPCSYEAPRVMNWTNIAEMCHAYGLSLLRLRKQHLPVDLGPYAHSCIE